MSIYKRCVSRTGSVEQIRSLVQYIFNEQKTTPQLCHTSGVGTDTIYADMLFLKELYCKTQGRQCLHWVISHDAGVESKVVDCVAIDIIDLLRGEFQVAAATHINTKNCHTHFIINSVKITTGIKFSESKRDMMSFRTKINDVLQRYGLERIEKIEEVSQDEISRKEVRIGSQRGTKLFVFPTIEQSITKPFSVGMTRKCEKPFIVEKKQILMKPFIIGETQEREKPFIVGEEYRKNSFHLCETKVEQERPIIRGNLSDNVKVAKVKKLIKPFKREE